MNYKKQSKSSFGLIIIELFLLFLLLFPLQDVISHNVNYATLEFLVMLNILLSMTVIAYCIEGNNIKKRFGLFSFDVAFTVLILGTFIANLGDRSIWGKHVFQAVSYISLENEGKGLLYIFLSLFFVLLSYQTNTNIILNFNGKSLRKSSFDEDLNIVSVMRWTKIFMYIGGVAAFFKVGSKAIYVMIYGYASTYTNMGDAIYYNSFIDLFDKFFILGLIGYLATFPPRKKMIFPLVLFVLYNVLSLFTGIRGEIVTNALFLIWYFMKRDSIVNDEKKHITKTKMLLMAVLSMVVIVFLYDYGYSRLGQTSNADNFIGKIFDFIDSQGGSGRLVSLALENREQMLDYLSPFMMIVWPINVFFVNNSFIRSLTGGVIGQTYDALIQAPKFSSVLTYITNYDAYVRGGGLGTCYIAELANSFGIVSIVVFNIVLGKLFKVIDNVSVGNWKKTVFIFNSFTILTYIPRQATMMLVIESVTLVLFIFMISVLCKSNKKN